MSKARIAIITTHPIQYNAPVFRLLAQRGILDIKVFYSWGESALEKKYDPDFGRVIEWDVPLLEGYAYEFLENSATEKGSHHFKGIKNPDLISKIELFAPRAILVYGWSFQSHLSLMRHYSGKIPIIFRGDSTALDDHRGLKVKLRYLFLRWVYSHVDKALYTGKSNKTYFLKSGLSEEQLYFGPHVVNNDFFEGGQADYEEQAAAWRKELGIAPEDIVFLFAGKLEPKKSPLLLLEAFQEADMGKQVHLLIGGNGVLEQQLKESSRSTNIHFVGFTNQSRMPVLYRVGDVFVLPSGGPGETWGLSLNEAMACGRAILASDRCGATADLVEEGKTGYSFEAGNKSALINRLRQMASDRSALRQMGQYAHSFIQSFSPETLCSVIESIA